MRLTKKEMKLCHNIPTIIKMYGILKQVNGQENAEEFINGLDFKSLNKLNNE